MFAIYQPAAQLVLWHRQHLVSKFAETIRKSIHGEEVSSFSAVN